MFSLDPFPAERLVLSHQYKMLLASQSSYLVQIEIQTNENTIKTQHEQFTLDPFPARYYFSNITVALLLVLRSLPQLNFCNHRVSFLVHIWHFSYQQTVDLFKGHSLDICCHVLLILRSLPQLNFCNHRVSLVQIAFLFLFHQLSTKRNTKGKSVNLNFCNHHVSLVHNFFIR